MEDQQKSAYQKVRGLDNHCQQQGNAGLAMCRLVKCSLTALFVNQVLSDVKQLSLQNPHLPVICQVVLKND